MPRIARAEAPGFPHHVTQRGNYQHPVFDSEDDFKQYLQWLEKKREAKKPPFFINSIIHA